MSVGIASLQRKPPLLAEWLAYHMDSGVTAFFLRFEDDDGKALAEAQAAVQAFNARAGARAPSVRLFSDSIPYVAPTKNNYVDVNARQAALVDAAVAIARREGVEWLFHIDDDELLYAYGKSWPDVMREHVPRTCDTIHISNWEAFAPPRASAAWIRDPDVRYMPRACAQHFAVYANGKAACRTTAEPAPRAHGVHRFYTPKRDAAWDMPEDVGVVLHHDSLPESANDSTPPRTWVEKHRLRIGSDFKRIPFEATRSAIDAVRSGDASRMAEVWKRFRTTAGSQFAKCKMPRSVQLRLHG